MSRSVGYSRMTRRQFLAQGCAVASTLLLGLPALTACVRREDSQTTPSRHTPTPANLHKAMHYRVLDHGRVQCDLCFRQCVVADGQLGFCRNKKNVGGTYYSLIYGLPCALQIDPIEKEPIFHMLPGSTIFCTGTASCNSRCKFCQNWEMSQNSLWQTVNYETPPGEVIRLAKRAGCQAVSFTYNEPTVFYEYMYDIIGLAKKEGLRAVCHTNGTMLTAPLLQLLDRLDAITVDLKAFTAEFYAEVCALELEPVLATLQSIAATGVHLELVNLVIPSLNDDLNDIRRMCRWIVENLGPEVPLHFTRFFPAYRMRHVPPTPLETLEAALAIADEVGLHYVYIGNVPGHKRNSTFCPRCGQRLIYRVHFTALANEIVGGACRFCGQPIAGIWAD